MSGFEIQDSLYLGEVKDYPKFIEKSQKGYEKAIKKAKKAIIQAKLQEGLSKKEAKKYAGNLNEAELYRYYVGTLASEHPQQANAYSLSERNAFRIKGLSVEHQPE